MTNWFEKFELVANFVAKLRDCELWLALSDLGFGGSCPGCGSPGLRLCEICATKLAAGRPRVVTRPLSNFPVTLAVHNYPDIANILISYKERGVWWLSRSLSPLLANLVDILRQQEISYGRSRASNNTGFNNQPTLTLVPMPSRAAAVAQRGEDVLWRLATGIKIDQVRHHKLLKNIASFDQSQLGHEARFSNMSQSILVRNSSPRNIILIDDIVTTGASLAAATAALEAAHHRVIGAVVLAEAGHM